jgi:hypothetical protein
MEGGPARIVEKTHQSKQATIKDTLWTLSKSWVNARCLETRFEVEGDACDVGIVEIRVGNLVNT